MPISSEIIFLHLKPGAWIENRKRKRSIRSVCKCLFLLNFFVLNVPSKKLVFLKNISYSLTGLGKVKENNTTSKGENNTIPGYSALDFNDVDPFKDANHRYGDPFDIEGNC